MKTKEKFPSFSLYFFLFYRNLDSSDNNSISFQLKGYLIYGTQKSVRKLLFPEHCFITVGTLAAVSPVFGSAA